MVPDMLSKTEAEQMISKSSKYQHMMLVSRIMKYLAKRFHADENEWEITGMLHDLDYDITGDDSDQHGVLAASMLDDRVPEEVKQAIRAHHPLTGYRPATLLDKALVFADCSAWLIADQGLLDAHADLKMALTKEGAQKPIVVRNVQEFASASNLSIEDMISNLVPIGHHAR